MAKESWNKQGIGTNRGCFMQLLLLLGVVTLPVGIGFLFLILFALFYIAEKVDRREE